MVAREYDFWLFDLDGTIVDADWGYTRDVFDEVGERLGYRFTDRQAELLWHGFYGPRNEMLTEWGLDPETFWSTFHDVEDPQVRAQNTFLHDDAADVADLDGPVGLVTHCQRFLADPVLDHLDIRDWFDTVLCCTDDTGWKPDPEPVRSVMADLGVAHNGHEGVLAGDGPSDVGAAWNAGLDAVHVERHDPHDRGHCVRADYRVNGFDELDL
ncbi:HAD family hydrolase [Halobacteriales archaeon QS_1_68_20]|nr:MAG: HAD family hydrolase [Halobacteriales archaeon QS_1_68_20]